MASQHFIENHPERKDVRSRVGFVALHLLRGHVLQGPQYRAFGGDIRILQSREFNNPIRRQLRQAEIQQLGSRFGQHDVVGFEVSMDYSVPMDLIESVADFHSKLHYITCRQRSLFEPACQCLSFQMFHDEVIKPILVPDVMNHANVGVVQIRYGLCFTSEALLQVRTLRNILEKNLDCNRAVQAKVCGFIYRAHPA